VVNISLVAFEILAWPPLLKDNIQLPDVDLIEYKIFSEKDCELDNVYEYEQKHDR
jgi:hypothetical protein